MHAGVSDIGVQLVLVCASILDEGRKHDMVQDAKILTWSRHGSTLQAQSPPWAWQCAFNRENYISALLYTVFALASVKFRNEENGISRNR